MIKHIMDRIKKDVKICKTYKNYSYIRAQNNIDMEYFEIINWIKYAIEIFMEYDTSLINKFPYEKI